MKSKKNLACFCAVLGVTASMMILAGCGGSKNYADGTYEGQSTLYENEDGSEEGNGYGVVNIIVKDNKIVDATFKTYEPDGTPKGEDYGKAEGEIANRDYYNKAQKAVAACDQYAAMLVANGQLEGIDAISGATINYGQFQEAVKEALKKAEVK